jgi:hypothetical protein
MAFINKYLTDEEMKRFAEAKIKNPVRFNLANNLLNPYDWTVDEERKIALINCGVADREQPDVETFAFINTDLKDNDILVFDMAKYYIDENEIERLKKKYNVNTIANWEIRKIDNLESTKIVGSKDEFLNILEEALTAYGVSGNPRYIPNVKVFIKGK